MEAPRDDGAADGWRSGWRGLAAGERRIECIGEVVARGRGPLGAKGEIAVVDAAVPEDGLGHDRVAVKDSGLRGDVDVRVGEKAWIGSDELGQRCGVRILRLMCAHGCKSVSPGLG